MKLIKSIPKLRRHIQDFKNRSQKIGFIPTMGYLHKGHLSLIKKSVQENDITIISIFVNPTQFGPQEDYARYPRDLKRDFRLAEKEGVDILFYPSVQEMYPVGYCTSVIVKGLSDVLCGKSRPGHFEGVATVCNKLFNIIQPDRAYFGQKDAQQAVIIKQMVQDLNMPLKIRVQPIVREKDGLALSSRNLYLSKKEREQARVLYKSLEEAKRLFESGERNCYKIKRKVRNMISKMDRASLDYVEIVDIEKLKPLVNIKQAALLALAVWFGKTRLIDNIILKP